MQNGDIIEIVSKGRAGTVPMVNVYHLLATDVVVPVGDFVFKPEVMTNLLNLNREWLIEDIQPWTTAGVAWTGIEVRNLFNPLEVAAASYTPELVGTNAGELNTTFACPNITSTRKIVGMHGGRKALAPCVEAVTGGNSANGGLLTSLATMAAKWNDGWVLDAVAGVSMELTSVVVKRVRTATDNPRRPWKYNLPTSPIGAVYYIADNWKPETFLGSQVSRKQPRT